MPALGVAFEYGVQQITIDKIIYGELRKKSFNKYKPCEDCYVFPTKPSSKPWSGNPRITNKSGIVGDTISIKQNKKSALRTIIPVCWKK